MLLRYNLVGRGPEETIFQKKNPTQVYEGYSTSQTTREMQIKTTMRYYFAPVRMDIINKITNNKFWKAHGGKGTLVHCGREYKLVQLL